MHLAQDVLIQPGGTETRHGTAQEDIFDDAVAMERKESQTKLPVPPSGPSVDASYELSKPGHDPDSDGLHDGKKRAQSEERSMGPCMRCLTRQIRCRPNPADPLAPCLPCLKLHETRKNDMYLPCTRPRKTTELGVPAMHTAFVNGGRSAASIDVAHAQTSSVPPSILDAGGLGTPLSDPANNGKLERAPIKCRAQGCAKEFERVSDLLHHERKHIRPWKCSVSTCKYHESGFSEMRDLQRHYRVNHSIMKLNQAEHLTERFKCLYSPCPYVSNDGMDCHLHMKKTHASVYVWPSSHEKTLTCELAAHVGIEPESPGSHSSTPWQERDERLQIQGRPLTEIHPAIGDTLYSTELEDSFDREAYRAFRWFDATESWIDLPETEAPSLRETVPKNLEDHSNLADIQFFEPHTASGNLDGVGLLTDLPEFCAATDSGYASLGRVAELQAKGVLNDVPNDAEDSTTVYSVANSVSQDDVEMYTSQFAEALVDFISSATQSASKDAALVQAVGASLPNLLRAFSLRLGCAGSSSAEREVMYFIHKHRVDIASRFEFALIFDSQASDCGSSSKPREKTDLSAVHSFIRGWLDGVEDEGEHHNLPPPTLNTDEGCDVLSEAGEPSDQTKLPNRHDYIRIVFESAAYRWLTASLRKEFLLASVPSQLHLSGLVYSEVVLHLDGGRKSVSSKRSSDLHTFKLQVNWNIKAFLQKEYGTSQESFGQLLGKTITLTGSETDAQAQPCEGYLRQTWPASGPGLMALLARALDSDDEVEAILPDKTQVKLDFKLVPCVEIRGTSCSIAEVVDQIAWLGAALRTSESRISGPAESLSLCWPIIHISPGLHKENSPPTYISTLSFQTALIPNVASATNTGQCWHRLFRNSCIAVGYPIPRRSKYDTGLEIPLTIMARLAQSPRIHQWFGRYLLKGFSTAIVPSQRLDDAILWHLYYSDGERLPYPDISTIQCANVGGEEMAKGRHILGWCTEAYFYAGSKNTNYSIRESRLDSPGKDFSLEKVSFSVGQIVTGGCQFSIGRKDTPIRITRGGYVDKLRWIRQRYFTLYDVDDNRGFLVDGASTLLHLLRTSLHLSSVDEFASEFLFEPSKFQESTDPLKHNSALKVLLSEVNRKLPMYREDETTSTTIQHRIEQLYETLEKLVDHAHHAEATHKGVPAKPRLTTHLKGWDFADLAADRDPFHLKVANLPLTVTWADFTRAIPAVTLFGRGFGELIRPAAHHHPNPHTQTQIQTQACLDWMALPTNQYNLCVSVADLRAIARRLVGSNTPLTVAPGMVLCYNNSLMGGSSGGGGGGEIFRKCVCEGGRTEAAHPRKEAHGLHPVLELTSEGWGGKVGVGGLFGGTDGAETVDLAACPPDGAVILGTPKRKWPWSRQQILQSPTALSLPLGALDHQVALPQGASLVSVPSSASSAGSSASAELDSASGSGPESGSATPPTSVASGGSGGGGMDPAVGGGLGSSIGSGTKRQRGWCGSEDGSEGAGLGRVEGGRRRKMLGKIKETTRDIRAFVKGMPGRDGDMDMAGDVEMEEE